MKYHLKTSSLDILYNERTRGAPPGGDQQQPREVVAVNIIVRDQLRRAHVRAPSEGTPAATWASAGRTLILVATWAAACARARSRRKGRLLELGAGVPCKFL